VGVLDRRPADAVVAELREIGGAATAAGIDLADHETIAPAVDTVEEAFGDRTSILVNCAAEMTMGSLAETDPEKMLRVLSVNVVAAAMLARRVAPAMGDRGFGRIVNIASDTFDRPPAPGYVSYITAKGALVGLTRTLAFELGSSGITVNAISPGLTRTTSVSSLVPEEHFEGVAAAQAIKRSLEPSDYEGILGLLVSPEGEAITGQVIRVDAGLVMI
jgi:NAD(P)-dependent dehydrogenase (short-subunit alcohol dehydrogenase family)